MSASSSPLTARVYVTGTGVISCAGQSVQSLWESARAGHSGIVEGIGRIPLATLKSADESSENAALTFSMLAIAQAMTSAGWEKLDGDDGLIFATTTGQIPIWDKALIAYLREEIKRDEFDRVFAHQPLGALMDAIADRLSFSGRSFITSTACTAATQALALGSQWIAQGRVKRCLVVGTEVLCTLTVEGFRSLQLLSPHSAKPFDVDRKGINLSEGSAALCLEGSNASDRALVCISGVGLSSDSFHMTAPQPQGEGCREAIQQALSCAGLQAQDISWIHAHGTGSPHNDSSEGAAIEAVFGTVGPPVSSTKGIHGHSLGASGALETVLCIEAMKRGEILATYGLSNPDPTIRLNVARENKPLKLQHILKLTLGFGGANAALVLSSPQASVRAPISRASETKQVGNP